MAAAANITGFAVEAVPSHRQQAPLFPPATLSNRDPAPAHSLLLPTLPAGGVAGCTQRDPESLGSPLGATVLGGVRSFPSGIPALVERTVFNTRLWLFTNI